VFFNPATGANALESDILAKYESLGGPAGSDLGFPTANESDGGIGPSSRIAAFAAADKPVIFWTHDHGAFVVRGAVKVAWDKLRGPSGKLGAPVGDQAVAGDVVSQQFTGGKIWWNRAKNSFTTDPSNLAALLSGLQVPGQNQPSTAAIASHAKKFTWHWWWLLVAIPVLALVALSALGAVGWRRRRVGGDTAAYEPAVSGRWVNDDADLTTDHFQLGDVQPPEHQPPADAGRGGRVSWSRGAGAAGLVEDVEPGAYGEPEYGEGSDHFEALETEEDPDAVRTDSIPVVSEAALAEAGYADVPEEAGYSEEGYPEVPEEGAHPEAEDAGYEDAGYEDAGYEDAAYADAAYEDADYEDAGYPDVAVPRTPPEAAYRVAGTANADEPGADELDATYPDVAVPYVAYSDVAYSEAAAPDAELADDVVPEVVVPEVVVPEVVASDAEPRTGRHAAIDDEDLSEFGSEAAGAAPAPGGRPTIHLPLDDPYEAPDGYPIKASVRSGLYYTPDSELYYDTLAEFWLSSEEVAQANGFVKAD
jgi:uncharacterized protein with LGFP repeats